MRVHFTVNKLYQHGQDFILALCWTFHLPISISLAKDRMVTSLTFSDDIHDLSVHLIITLSKKL